MHSEKHKIGKSATLLHLLIQQSRTVIMSVIETTLAFGIGLLVLNFDPIYAMGPNMPDFRDIPVRLIDSSRHFNGNKWFYSPGVVMPAEDGIHSYVAESLHDCHVTCWSHPHCMAFSVEPEDGELNCVLSDLGPQSHKLERSAGAKYFFALASIKNKAVGIMPDGVNYVLLIRRTFNYTISLRNCRQIPGHDLGVFESNEELEVVHKLSQDTGSPCGWTNNKNDESALEQIRYYKTDQSLNDLVNSVPCNPVCRARIA